MYGLKGFFPFIKVMIFYLANVSKMDVVVDGIVLQMNWLMQLSLIIHVYFGC
jgi:hypothetical protein